MASLVAAGHPATVHAAALVLERGGNAFDAIIGAAAAATISEPGLTSAAGGGFLMASPAGGEPVLFDFFVDTPGLGGTTRPTEVDLTPITVRFPSAEQEFWVGPASIAVPGSLPGWLHIHERLGRIPLTDVLAPAIELADAGAEVNQFQRVFFELLEPVFTLTAGARAIFAPGGEIPSVGELTTNPALGHFYAEVANGRRFDDPDLIAAVTGELEGTNAALTPADLAGYRVIEREPLRIRYRDATLFTNPGPSLGGQLVGRALERLDDRPAPPSPESPGHLTAVVDALSVIAPGSDQPQAKQGTTHMSVIDEAGNVASMTSSNGTGSGVILAGTGVHANNIMGEADLHPDGWFTTAPGLRVGSMMAPSILERPGRAPIALGSGGSERIRSAITQFVVQVVDFDRTLGEATVAPRAHVEHGVVHLEPGFSPEAVDAIAGLGPIRQWSDRDLYFGGVHAVSASGEHCGDPRRGGTSTAVGS